MRQLLTALGNMWKHGPLHRVYGIRDEKGRGRLCLLLTSLMSGIVTNLSSGLFYTGFLLQHGIQIVDIALITFIPSITSLLNLFSPWLLERFKRRKYILVAGKLLYYIINILGITLLPLLVKDPDARLIGFIGIIVVAGSINALITPGFTAWNANFLPDDIRMDYFSVTGCITSFFTYLIVLSVSVITDSLKAFPDRQLSVLTWIRWIAFLLAIVDCIILLLPKEYPYAKTAKGKLSDIFTLPLRNRPFLYTVLLCAAYNFSANLPNVTLNAHVLNILTGTSVQYTLPSAIDATFFLFFILLTAVWKRFIAKYYWFRAFGYVLILQAISYFAYGFVIRGCIILYVAVRFSQHILGVVINPIVSSLPYVNLPDTDRTNYLAFYTIAISFSNLASMLLGTLFTALMTDENGVEEIITVLGYPFNSTQLLLIVSAVLRVATAIYAIAMAKRLTPPDALVRKT